MHLPALVYAYIRHKPLTFALNVVMFACGTALAVTLLQLNDRAARTLSRDLAGIDLAVGAKGSPLQLILSTVFHADNPTGNIPLEEAERIRNHPLTALAIPIALGDNVQGFRIVGTSPAYADLYGAKPAQGVMFAKPMEAVLGAETAARTGLTLGDRFAGAHGLAAGGEVHADQQYTVTGVLAPTGAVIDRLALTSDESVRRLHAGHDHHHEEEGAAHEDAHDEHAHDEHHHDEHAHDEHHHDEHGHDEHAHEAESKGEITALLIKYKSAMGAAVLPKMIKEGGKLQAAIPANEAARLNRFIGTGTAALSAFGGFLILLAGFGVFASLTNAMNERRADLAMMRCMGAPPRLLLAAALAESAFTAFVGTLAGLAIGHGCANLAAQAADRLGHASLAGGVFLPQEALICVAALIAGMLAGLPAALRAARTDVRSSLVC